MSKKNLTLQPKREPNYTPEETELLTNLVMQHSDILENKVTNAVNNKMKEEAWAKLAFEFNSSTTTFPRDAKSLRAKYENIKKSLKRKYSVHQRKLYGTGGGPRPKLVLTPDEEVLMEITGPSVEGLPARHDGDQIELVVDSEEAEAVKDDSDADQPEAKKKVIDTPTPSTSKFLLRNKMSTPLKKKRNNESYSNVMGDYSDLAKKKSELIDAQIKSIEEKMKLEAIEHSLRCELLKVEIELKKQQLNKYPLVLLLSVHHIIIFK